MRNGAFSRGRRVAAVCAVSLVTLLVTGTGAGAAVGLETYSAVGNAQVLHISLTLPTALSGVGGLPRSIEETISFSRVIGQVDPEGIIGNGLGQMFDGTLNPLLEQAAASLGKPLPKAYADLRTEKAHAALAELTVGGLVNVGAGVVNASSVLKAATGTLGKAVVGGADSQLLGVGVDWGTYAKLLKKNALFIQLRDSVDNVGVQLNKVIADVTKDSPVPISLQLPKVEELLNQPLLSIGLIETESSTGFAGAARTASAVARLANVSAFGTGDTALVHADSIVSKAFAQIDGTAAGAKATDATSRIAGLRVLKNQIDVNADSIVINGQKFEAPAQIRDTVNGLLEQLKTTLGLEITLLGKNTLEEPMHAVAEANSIRVRLAPKVLGGDALFALEVTAPAARAEVAGGPLEVLGKKFPRTGVPNTVYFLAGPAMLGMAILVRRFALTK